jgi:hypothetical protein
MLDEATIEAEEDELEAVADVLETPLNLPETICIVSSADPLEFCITTSFYEAIMNSAFVAGVDSEDDKPSTSTSSASSTTDAGLMVDRSYAAFVLINATGHPLKYTADTELSSSPVGARCAYSWYA